MKVAVVKEAASDERRVALVPETVAKLRTAGLEVLVESGAGDRAWLADGVYAEAGASIVAAADVAEADAILMVGQPSEQLIGLLRPGHTLFGLLAPLANPALAKRLAAAGVTAISLDLIPRTLPRAQPMDALSSQANIAGYKAAVLAAATFGRFFPLLITAAGTARPARVLILGTGVAGLQAIGTARRLGAVVTAYDVRPATKTEVQSLGATFLELTAVGPAAGEGGYARALTEDERQAQQDELTGHIVRHDVVITTAQVPGAAAGASHRRRGKGDDGRLGDRGHGSQRPRRQRRWLGSRRDRHPGERHYRDRRGQPAVDDAGRGVGHVRAQRQCPAALPDERWRTCYRSVR